MHMSEINMSMFIAAPVDQVFRAFTDFEHAAERINGITRTEMLTPAPVGTGTRFRETRVMFGREATEEMAVSRFEEGSFCTLTASSCGMHYESEFQFHPEGQGTRVDMTLRTRPLTLVARLLSPLGSLMSGPMKKCLQADMDDMRAYLERQTATAG
jgi:hypothetical protein